MNDDPPVAVQVGGIHAQLTGRQLEVFTLIAQGYVYREIALILCISERCVQERVVTVCTALGARTSREALSLLKDAGMLAESM